MYEQPAATSLEPAVYIEQRKPRKTKRGLDPQTARDTEADDLEAEDINDQQPPAKALKIQAAASVEGEDFTALAAGAKRKPKSKAKKPQAKDSDGPTAAKSSKPKAKAKAKALKAAPAEGKDFNGLAAAAGESQPEGKAKDPNPNDEPKRKAKDEALEPPRQTAEAEDDPARDLGDEAMNELVKLSVDELCTLHGGAQSGLGFGEQCLLECLPEGVDACQADGSAGKAACSSRLRDLAEGRLWSVHQAALHALHPAPRAQAEG